MDSWLEVVDSFGMFEQRHLSFVLVLSLKLYELWAAVERLKKRQTGFLCRILRDGLSFRTIFWSVAETLSVEAHKVLGVHSGLMADQAEGLVKKKTQWSKKVKNRKSARRNSQNDNISVHAEDRQDSSRCLDTGYFQNWKFKEFIKKKVLLTKSKRKKSYRPISLIRFWYFDISSSMNFWLLRNFWVKHSLSQTMI